MRSKAKRTLVKSAPELWELASDVERMEAWTAEVVGSDRPVPVEVVDADAERALAWRAADPGADARITIELSESGFGTAVRISVEHPASERGAALDVLEALLDELGAPERRPFTRA